MKKFYKSVVIVVVALCGLYFSGCTSVNQLYYSPQISESLGFTVQGNSVLENPPPDRARIYFGRKGSFFGVAVVYKAYFAYNPPTDNKGRIRVTKSMAEGDFGTLASGSRFVADVGVGTPLAIFSSTEETSYLVFTPMAGRVYCVEGEVVSGAFVGRPQLSFVDRMRCEALFRK